MTKRKGKGAYMISVVAEMYEIHPQTLRLYEREGLLKPSRSEGNTRLYTEDDLKRLEFILSLARDLGVNIAGIGIILNMRERIEQMQHQMQDFVQYVQQEVMLRAQSSHPKDDALVPVRRSGPVVIPPAAGPLREEDRRIRHAPNCPYVRLESTSRGTEHRGPDSRWAFGKRIGGPSYALLSSTNRLEEFTLCQHHSLDFRPAVRAQFLAGPDMFGGTAARAIEALWFDHADAYAAGLHLAIRMRFKVWSGDLAAWRQLRFRRFQTSRHSHSQKPNGRRSGGGAPSPAPAVRNSPRPLPRPMSAHVPECAQLSFAHGRSQ